MATKIKDCERYSVESLEKGGQDPKGRIFVSGVGIVDLSRVLICHAGVDTIRQLYRGTLKRDMLDRLEKSTENGPDVWDLPWGKWHIGRIGKDSGYKYKLQNNDFGAVILVKNYYAESDKEHVHCKIELSPHMIAQRSKEKIQQALNLMAGLFLIGPVPDGVAVHLAVDCQGWELPKDFQDKFVSRARRSGNFRSIDKLEFDLSEAAVTYGQGETIMYGRADSLQVCIYRKDREIVKRDKVDYWHNTWAAYTFGAFDSSKPVWRAEMRFHHSVVRSIGLGSNFKADSFEDIADYLGDLWRYAFTINRLHLSPTYVDPMWQLLRDDIEFYIPATGLWIRRERKRETTGIRHNIGNVVGNLITICARQNFTVNQVMRELKKLAIYDDILRDYYVRGYNESHLRQQVEKGLLLRRLIGKAA